MGHFRFRRSFGNKFLRINISKSGFSLSGGVPGARVNVPLLNTRKRKAYGSLGLPGSGLSYRQEFGPSYGEVRRGSGATLLQQVIYLIIGISVIAALWGILS